MNNYITIESGYYEPFKENETNPELKIWADKYFEIIKMIHEVLMPYNKRFEHFVELEDKLYEQIKSFLSRKQFDRLGDREKREELSQSSFKDEMNSLFEDNEIGFFNSLIHNNEDKSQDLLWRFQHLFDFMFYRITPPPVISLVEDELLELKEELRKCLLHRAWKSNYSRLIKESNIVSVEFYNFEKNYFDRNTQNADLLFRTCSPWNIALYQFKRQKNYDSYCYEGKDEINMSGRYSAELDINKFVINDIKSKGDSPISGRFLSYFVRGFVDISSMCSIEETYKDFQSGNIEKVIKDKIKCGGFKFYSDFGCRY